MKVRDRILVVTELMLGAVYADGTFTGEENEDLRKLLAMLLLCTPETLPTEVDRKIREFSPTTFDLPAAAKDFLSDPPMKKRRLLELMARLVEKDGFDLREDEYIRALGAALGMAPAEYADLVLEYDIERLRESLEMIRVAPTPPPLPSR
jgi:uncharacterized tellurite resistance protein B-like protein